MRRSQLVVLAVVMVVCFTGCKTTPVEPQYADTYEYVAQVLAMPSRVATAVEVGPCYARFTAEDGRTFYIGSPGCAPEVWGFVGTLEEGKTYYLPEAFMEYQRKQKTPNKTTGGDLQ